MYSRCSDQSPSLTRGAIGFLTLQQSRGLLKKECCLKESQILYIAQHSSQRRTTKQTLLGFGSFVPENLKFQTQALGNWPSVQFRTTNSKTMIFSFNTYFCVSTKTVKSKGERGWPLPHSDHYGDLPFSKTNFHIQKCWF